MGMGRKPRIARCGPEAGAPTGLHEAGRRLAPPRDRTRRAGGLRPHGIARGGPEACAPTGAHDAGRRPAPPRGCTMRAGGPRTCRGARGGPEACAPTGVHEAGRRLAPPRGCTMRAGGPRTQGTMSGWLLKPPTVSRMPVRCGPEAGAPTGLPDAGRRLAPLRGCPMRAGGWRPYGVARCGPEARAPR